jgi:hypothetical protein
MTVGISDVARIVAGVGRKHERRARAEMGVKGMGMNVRV